jgi:hypothetical protein
MDVAGHGMDRCVQYAHLGYLWLPLFLGVVAGICLLIATVRGALTSGIAAGLGALGGIVVIGVVLGFALPHGPGKGKEAKESETVRGLRELHTAIERLQAKVVRIEAALGEKKGFMEPLPPSSHAPLPEAPAGSEKPPIPPPPSPPSENAPGGTPSPR